MDRLRAATYLLAVLLAYTVPRAVVLRGMSEVDSPRYGDMEQLLHNADKLAKTYTLTLPPEDQAFLRANPRVRLPAFPDQWPPGVYVLTVPLARTLGVLSVWTPQLVNALFTAILLWALLGLGRALGRAEIGAWAGVLAVLVPPLFGVSLFYCLDYPLTAMVTAGLLLLLRTEGFSRGRACAAFAVLSALGALVKMTYALYLLGPCAAALVLGLRRQRPAVVLRNAALALALALGLFFALYYAALGWVSPAGILERTLEHLLAYDKDAARLRPFTLQWALALGVFVADSFPAPLLALALPGLLALHRGRAGRAGWPLLLFFWGTYVGLTAMASKLERYVQVIYPALCLVTVWWAFDALPPRWRRRALVGLVLAYAGVHALTHLYPLPWFLASPLVPGQALQSTFWYEGDLPTQQDLAAMRSPGSERRCLHRHALRQLRETVAAGGPRAGFLSVVVVTPDFVLNQVRTLRSSELVDDDQFRLVLTATAAWPDRLFSFIHADQRELADLDPYLRAPRVLVVHATSWQPEEHLPHLQALATRAYRFRCGERDRRAAYTLLRPRR